MLGLKLKLFPMVLGSQNKI